ncbi:hypothetical protein [Microbacterium deminutum]|uniref:hypothetical protein n=1 Tax=Microbacterium deminutum TaxID=344164 RepID=UPI0031D20A85
MEIPFIDSEGTSGRAQIRVGWRIDTIVTYECGEADELIDVDAIFPLLDKMAMLRGRRIDYD